MYKLLNLAVLMLYNDVPRQAFSLKEMMDQLNMPKEQLVPVVGSLVKVSFFVFPFKVGFIYRMNF